VSKIRVLAPGALAAALAVAVLVTGQSATAQKTRGKTRPAETKYLMRCVVGPSCTALGKLVKDAPTDDKGWDKLTQHAAVLNEMSFVVMDDGRCPDKIWADAATAMRECSGKVLDAVKARDADAAQAAFKALTGSCSGCHRAHKAPKK
jgi:cytochrome c556